MRLPSAEGLTLDGARAALSLVWDNLDRAQRRRLQGAVGCLETVIEEMGLLLAHLAYAHRTEIARLSSPLLPALERLTPETWVPVESGVCE